MSLETAQYIDSLVETNPTGTDSRTTADDHIRLIKSALKRTFTGVTGNVTGSHTTLNRTNDLTSSAQLQLNALKDDKADKTGTAQYAITADSAASAVYAFSATNATSAVFATSATRATSAMFADSASYAHSAGNALVAVFAASATRATSAKFANSASFAYSALYADIVSGGGITSGVVNAARLPNASIGGQGVAEFVTTAEYAVGTDLTRIISPGTFGKPRSLPSTTNGDFYYTLPGGLTVQGGRQTVTANNSTSTTSFHVPFNYVYNVQVTVSTFTSTSTQDNQLGVDNVGTTTFVIVNGLDSQVPVYWVAYGRI